MSIYHFGFPYNENQRGDTMHYPRIRDLREDRDLYQRDLAEYLHCTQVTYSRYELGTRDIPTEVLIALANFYQTSIDYLLGQTDLKHPVRKSEGIVMRNRIRDLREDADLTQTQIAQYLKMSQTGYSKYETGENDIPTAVWHALADFYKTSVDYLMGRTDEKSPYSRKK